MNTLLTFFNSIVGKSYHIERTSSCLIYLNCDKSSVYALKGCCKYFCYHNLSRF